MAQVFLNLPSWSRLCAFAHAVPSDLPFIPISLVCPSGSCLLFGAQLKCRLLQEGAPDFSPSAHPYSLSPSRLGCTSSLHAFPSATGLFPLLFR